MEARASLSIRGATFEATGRAIRSPEDPDLPAVGEELAVSRALSELSHRLLDAAYEAISAHEAKPMGSR